MKLSDFPEVDLPKRLKKCPIYEAVLEVRFSSPLDDDAIYGAIYSAVRKDWGSPKKLPVSEIPSVFRKTDPNLKFSPHYRLSRDNLLLQIGPAVLSIVAKEPYPGSEKLFSEFDGILSSLKEKEIFDAFQRIGVRYIDFFETDLFSGLKSQFLLADVPLSPERTTITTVIKGDEGFDLTLRLAGQAMIQGKGGEGSVLDIDAAQDGLNETDIQKVGAMLASAHLQQKKLFFGLLEKDFLDTFEPEYANE